MFLRVDTSGVLALLGEEKYPYTVLLSYVYDKDHNHIYVHGTNERYKLDCNKHHDKASFGVVNKDETIINRFDTMFRSTMAFGKIRIIDDERKKRHALTLLDEKLSIQDNPELNADIERV
ncbi:MAG: pyridoxamine 5'-phosphate oxidase family protein [Veillonella atypica]|uniref:pyridoxamine 5'-phosphate oxidase family protein n=1 Tax=Veillonella atypica TaxID=39777 RepID=UPI003995D8D6